MRVVVVHNRYGSAQPSGENQVVDDDLAELRNDDVDVVEYQQHSDDIGAQPMWERALLPVRPTWSPIDARRFSGLVSRFRPDVVHLHNVYPLISPSAITIAARGGARVVQTVHNYRHACVNGIRYRDGGPCDDCVGRRVPLPAVRHRCYRDSVGGSIAMATSCAVRRPAWRLVDQFFPVGPGVADFLERIGVEPERIRVVPNRVTAAERTSPPGEHVAFIGRLTVEKGIGLLLDAWERLGPAARKLVIAGDGPEREVVARRAAAIDGVEYLGLLDQAGVDRLIEDAAIVVVPSLWHEPDPLVAVRAMSAGRPVLATRLGSFPHYVPATAGWLVEPTLGGFVGGLREALAAPRHELERRGEAARDIALAQRSGRPRLTALYQDVISMGTSR